LLNNNQMSNIPQETIERIKAEAERYAEKENSAYTNDYNGYYVGATEWVDKAQALAEAIMTVYKDGPSKQSTIDLVGRALVAFYGNQQGVDSALAKYKEVSNGK